MNSPSALDKQDDIDNHSFSILENEEEPATNTLYTQNILIITFVIVCLLSYTQCLKTMF